MDSQVAQGLLALRVAAGDRDELGGRALLLQAHRLFDGDLVEGVHAHLHIGNADAGAVARRKSTTRFTAATRILKIACPFLN
jgi:hypothetical protein